MTQPCARIVARLTGISTVVISLLPSLPANSDVTLPKVFGSHMVLQREQPVVVWGRAAPGEKVTVQFLSEKTETQANEEGEWKAVLPAQKAGGPYTLTVAGSNTVTFEDVLVGEVWLCSGQSNMEMGLGTVSNGTQEVAAAEFPNIRLLMVPNRWTQEPQEDMGGTWKPCTPAAVAESGWGGFSACAYFFGRELHKELNVPIGLIDSTWGGTRIESWTPPEGVADVPALKAELDLVESGDPGNPARKQRLEQVMKQTEEWLASARAAEHPDWTFAANASSFPIKRLRVLVHCR